MTQKKSKSQRNRLLQPLRHLLLALQYFTRIPVTGALARWADYRPERLPHALAHLPGVGLLLGLAGALVLALALSLLPAVPQVPASAWVAALLATACGLLLTGGFHEDGLADLSDGLGGSYHRSRALEIMKDSRIGSFAAMALTTALLTKAALLAALVQAGAQPDGWGGAWLGGWALVAGQVCSRVAPLLITAWLPHVGDTVQSKSKPIATGLAHGTWAVALVWLALTLALLYAVLPEGPWCQALLGALAGGALVGWRLKVRLQGFTGDGLGAAQQLGELGCYLTLLACLPGPAAP